MFTTAFDEETGGFLVLGRKRRTLGFVFEHPPGEWTAMRYDQKADRLYTIEKVFRSKDAAAAHAAGI